ncbi:MULTISPECIES: 50S ribosomal protein L33 [Leptospira]|uniref:Large ribosomal subunit protein bL33 n=7 Tax=Leptospira TaxID=171 RepID=Q04NJ2_LEPBJ|nr:MULTISPECIES: 50S ribosomal protein L33 [Leptospira]EMM74449.1 ribosomal protein L33 [Leptospira weilii str. 2006001855]EMO62733.1 ribosomal protein L33 [Leptospira borgpetersenii serovar Pomona str. 200901868]EMY13710.1 ribosomal protein L33 [Leptospira weilii str. Ecochallenge]ABJ77528.1 Ribosomal protein L33 [Leptospira borgpetersenii serovar Hardjo-bovis str. JB197]ABJ80471.1 Ribosomal protein L33 [Leptospira borgpetersenii serovar Hardjo-bovis str. L550]
MREIIKLVCQEPGCSKGKSTYFLTKNKKAKTEKLVTKKFCKFCRKHTEYKETKV